MPAFRELVSTAKELPETLWEHEWRTPLLLVHNSALEPDTTPFNTRQPSSFDIEQSLASFVGQDDTFAFFLRKQSASSPFQDRVFVGRARTNDVVIAARGISKLHCYFREIDGTWVIADAGSKNGTFVAGERLDSRREVPLRNSSEVCVGIVRAMFVTPDAIAAILRKFV